MVYHIKSVTIELKERDSQEKNFIRLSFGSFFSWVVHLKNVYNIESSNVLSMFSIDAWEGVRFDSHSKM